MKNNEKKKHRMTLYKRKMLIGWAFIIPAAVLLVVFAFYPMVRALMLSFQHGKGKNVSWYGLGNYLRIPKDKVFSFQSGNVQYLLLPDHSGTDHAVPGSDPGIAFEHQRPQGKRDLPYIDLPALCNVAGILLHDLPVDLFTGWSYKPVPHKAGASCRRMVPECMGSTRGDHHCADLALDRVQHGILSCRSPEY